MDKIEIYTNDGCGYCKSIKEELTKNNIKFENKLTTNFKEEYQQIVNLTGIPTVPTIKYNNEYFVPGRDFQNPQQLINLIQSFETPLYSESKRAYERIKTLNYHINTAFGKMDQLLKQIETKINTDEHKSTD